MTFACLFAANVHYGLFGELQERPLPTLTTGSVIAIHYSKYGKLLRGLKDQLILDNDEIARDVDNIGDAGKAKDVEGQGDRNVGDAEDVRNVVDKKMGSGNERGDQENSKFVGDGVGVGRVLEDVEVGNNGMGNDARNQEN